jgi:aspartokinase
VIVAGSQGVSRLGETTTLERCGTSTTAVVLGAVFCAEVIEDREG